ncbi:hypothetical protein ScPMuIL_005444 [Solemya velum]
MAASLSKSLGLPGCVWDILSLPNEILEYILQFDCLDHLDICRTSRVCRTLRSICRSNEIWKRKLDKRWPNLFSDYPRCESYCWLKEFQSRYMFGWRVRDMVCLMSPQYYDVEEISSEGFCDFTTLMETHPNGWRFLVDELMEIIHKTNKFTDLTVKYYCRKVIRHILHRHLKEKWTKYFQQPLSDQHLETGAVMVAQWCQPTDFITENAVSDELDVIAQKVGVEMRLRFPTHPLCSMEIPVNGNDEVVWTAIQGREILDTVNHILFRQLGFSGNTSNYYDENNSFIDKVIQNRTGIPISMCIVYSSVARRLGLSCQPINFPSHFLLRWKERPLASPDQQYTYIDAFNGGKFLSQQACPSILSVPVSMETYQPVPPIKVFERMARNLVEIGRQQGHADDCLLCLRNALELYVAVSPDDVDIHLLHVRVNLHLNINLLDVIDSLQQIADLDQSRMGIVAYLMQAAHKQLQDNKTRMVKKKIEAKLRKDNKDVKFSIGTIMKHKRYHYTCVIYGWDVTCMASDEWIEQMGVNDLADQQFQPFYNVLVDDGTNRYAAQENMMFTSDPKAISHAEVGRYFTNYTGYCYIPNKEKCQEYPDDKDATNYYNRQYDMLDN